VSFLTVFRHARVLEKGLCYGRFDPDVAEVTDELDEDVELFTDVQSKGIELYLFSSPAERCLKVASLLSERLDLPIHVAPEITELSMGDWEGRPYSELEGLPAFSEWMENWQTSAPPRGEGVVQLEGRVRTFLRKLPKDGRVLTVSHAGVIRCLRVLLLGQTWVDSMSEPVPYLEGVTFESASVRSERRVEVPPEDGEFG